MPEQRRQALKARFSPLIEANTSAETMVAAALASDDTMRMRRGHSNRWTALGRESALILLLRLVLALGNYGVLCAYDLEPSDKAV
jgi:hypothetical protein